MGRAAKFDRQAAVATYMNEIWKNGFEANSVKAISEKLGITRSSFYNAFGSREALFLEALELYSSQSPDRVLNDIDDGVDIRTLLTDLFRNICRVRAGDAETRGCLAVNGICELVGSDDKIGPVLERVLSASIDRFYSILLQAAKKGEIVDDGKLHEKALALQNLMVGLNVMSKIVHSEAELFAIARQTLEGLSLYTD